MKKLSFLVLCVSFTCLLLSSCGGGEGGTATRYSLSVREFMRGDKCILIAGGDCAFAIVPQRFESGELTGPEALCNAYIYIYRNVQSQSSELVCSVESVTYSVDEQGVGYLSLPGVQPFSDADAWRKFCGVVSGTGGTFGDGFTGNYTTVSGLDFILNFGGEEKGTWQGKCWAVRAPDGGKWVSGDGTLLLRPKEYL